jgi:glycosyltransferase involved in cell wall biosynthesis
MAKKPLISCLCVTRDKPDYLERAIHYFQQQTYANRELVIVYEEDDPATTKVIHRYTTNNIRGICMGVQPKLSLGELRNLGVGQCRGKYFCQWDDDDWFNERRLEAQWRAIQNGHKEACVMVLWFMFDKPGGRAYISHTRPWEGSILCHKSIFDETARYAPLIAGEDSELINALINKNYLYPLIDPSLYIYVYHGKNTWGSEHFEMLFRQSQPLSDATSLIVKNILEGLVPHKEASRLMESKMVLEEIRFFRGRGRQATAD